MATCSVRWRPSGGRGEFEFVPAETLEGREIYVLIEPFGVTVRAEVRGVRANGKPRLRKFDPNKKMHLPQLVMALARLPEPAREDKGDEVTFPLENKSFLIDSMDFDIVDDDGLKVTLEPLRVSVRNTNFQINLQDHLKAIATDLSSVPEFAKDNPALAQAIENHRIAVLAAENSSAIRDAADEVLALQADIFGMSNAASVTKLKEFASLPESPLEEGYQGKEGRLLIRVHSYKERDPKISEIAKKHFRATHGGKLFCEVCGFWPREKYGEKGDRAIEAHHRTPVAELQPDSVTDVKDLAMVCASCHRVIHGEVPCLPLGAVLSQ